MPKPGKHLVASASLLGCFMLSACEGGVVEDTKGFQGGAYWQNGVCFERNERDLQVRVPPSNCPPQSDP